VLYKRQNLFEPQTPTTNPQKSDAKNAARWKNTLLDVQNTKKV
jgi:hypothetical protein